MGKHGICAFSRWLLHQLFAIVSIHAEGKCRQGIRNQVYPQNMTRLQRRRKAGQNRCKHCDNFPEIRRQEKQDRFADILINPTSLADCLLNCGKIIIRQNQVCGTLRLGSSLNFSHYRLPRIIKAYTDQYPLVDVQITTGQSKHLFQLLNRDEIAIAIMRGRYVWDEAIQLISSEPMCFVCSKENQGRSLSEYSYIGRHTDSDLSTRIDRWLTAHDLAQIRPHMWIDSIDTCKEMARYGLGWCILPRICLDDFDGYIEELYMEDGSPFLRNTYVLYKHQYAELPQVKLFLDALLGSSVSENKF